MISSTHFLDEAQDLLANAKTETRYRTVIGRAYYAAFHFLSAEAESAGFTPTGRGDDHTLLIRYLVGHQKQEFRHSGALLRRLKASRTQADYRLLRWIQHREAKDAFLSAEEIMEQTFPPKP